MRIILLGVVFFIFSVFDIKSQSNLWTDISESQFLTVGERYIIPDDYRTLKLNLSKANAILEAAPMEFTFAVNEGASVIELPIPDGTFQKFKFWESPTMAPELQFQYPEIRTYTGQGIDDPYATLKFDMTPHGFHAQILSPNGRVFIDPYSKGDIQHYISYYTKDFHKRNAEFECQLFSDDDLIGDRNYSSDELLTPSGPQLRTYRLAVAATGEYTVFHGGTVPLGLAAVVTSVNRVNGVYEKEVAVRMVLVANNNLIIYTNAATDPYSNTNGSAMLTQNINTLNSVIGSSNYDIGHVFSTGGGGVAYLGSVCTTNKAGGVTGSSSPIGDPFDIDYVAHEMGHQFGGNHTFNGNSGSCSGNRNSSTAFEPGSGSTIMAYAGICGTDNLQSNSDAYFHTISFDEIITFTNSGSGNSCAVNTATGNNAPIIIVPSGGFYIPKSTPFLLTGSATDPNGDAMTYCWEEYDLGPAGAPGTPSGDAPIFRSWNPSTSSTRIFPRLSDLLNNTSVIGELLPSYARNLKFRLTVRDNRAGGGGV
ncbi:MAG: M12 family metallo-peptidase, partial [Ignavibacteria bacterium]|nr:M12 family metallo-peptidase [Ignavibacteria bacterium]